MHCASWLQHDSNFLGEPTVPAFNTTKIIHYMSTIELADFSYS